MALSISKKSNLIVLIIFLASNSLNECSRPLALNTTNCYLPTECDWYKDSRTIANAILFCEKLNARFYKNKLADKSGQICIPDLKKKVFFSVEVFFNRNVGAKPILDNSFQLLNVSKHIVINNIVFFNDQFGPHIFFRNLRGFSVDLALEVPEYHNWFEFHNCEFSFFAGHSKNRIKSCDEYRNSIDDDESASRKNFILNWASRDGLEKKLELVFHNSLFKAPVCPLAFRKARIFELLFSGMINSYYKTNKIRFINEITSNETLDALIVKFSVQNSYGLILNDELISKSVFENTTEFLLDGMLNAIHDDFFVSFRKLKEISFNPKYFRDLVIKQGIEWLKAINQHIRVNLSDVNSMKSNMDNMVRIGFRDIDIPSFVNNPSLDYFYESDFCLFVDFPFEQLITFTFAIRKHRGLNCAIYWLMRHFPMFFRISRPFRSHVLMHFDKFMRFAIMNGSAFQQCSFDTLVKKCQKQPRNDNPNERKKNSKKTKKSKLETSFEFMVAVQFLLIVSTPVVCIFGMLTNSLIIVTVTRSSNRQKLLKEKQYTYMGLNSACHFLVLGIQLTTSVVNECHRPFGIYCSPVHKREWAQYFKIVFGETVATFLRLGANFAYVAFTMNRLALVGSSQGKCVKFVADLSVKTYMSFVVIVSAALSVVKGFRFVVNRLADAETFPMIFYRQNFELSANIPKLQTIYSLLFSFDAVCDLTNYVVFFVLNLVLDVILFFKMRQTFAEKCDKLNLSHAATANNDEKSKKKLEEFDEVIRRVLKMILINAFFNMWCKMPLSIVSVNDLRLVAKSSFETFIHGYGGREMFEFPYSMNVFCHIDEACLVFLAFGNFIFSLSSAVSIFFYKSFDRKFKLALEQTINSAKLNSSSSSTNNSSINS